MRLLFSAFAALGLLSAVTSAAAQTLPAPSDDVVVDEFGVWAEGSFLIMSQEFTSNGPIASTGGAGSGNVFSQSDFEPGDWEPGFELALGANRGPWGVEGRGFWLDTFTGSAAVFGPIPNVVVDTNPPTVFIVQPTTTWTGTSQSDVHGAEASVSYEALPNATVYAGPRWIELNEQFDLRYDFPTFLSELDTWRTHNELLGGQVGFRTDWIALLTGTPGVLSVETDTSIGLFHNWADADFNPIFLGVPIFTSAASDSESLLATVVDASITASLHPTPNVELFAGYNVLWLNGVANAVEQVSGTGNYNFAAVGTMPPPPLNIVEGSALFHGGKVGGRIRF